MFLNNTILAITECAASRFELFPVQAIENQVEKSNVPLYEHVVHPHLNTKGNSYPLCLKRLYLK